MRLNYDAQSYQKILLPSAVEHGTLIHRCDVQMCITQNFPEFIIQCFTIYKFFSHTLSTLFFTDAFVTYIITTTTNSQMKILRFKGLNDLPNPNN